MHTEPRVPFAGPGHHPGWALFGVLALRDPDLAIQGARSAAVALALARHVGAEVGSAEFWAFLLHDVGTLETPDTILRKSGPLTPSEQGVVGAHTVRSAQLLEQVPELAGAAVLALHHHERWDGAGYPHRLAGEAIPYGARLLAVADSFAAMTAPRPYRRARAPEQAVEVVVSEGGRQLDPELTAVFGEVIENLPDGLAQPMRAVALGQAVDRLDVWTERAQELSRAQLEALFGTALGMDAEDAAMRFGRSTGTQRNWSSSLRRTLACPPRVALPRFLTSLGRKAYQAVLGL